MHVRPAPRRAARAGARHRRRRAVDLDGVKAGFGLDPSVERAHPPRAAGPPRALIQHARCRGTAGSVARRAARHRPVLGRLRRPAVGPPARGRAADHGQGRRLRRDPRRRRRLQAAELDERPEHAGHGRRTVGRRQPQGRAADDHAARGAGRLVLGPRRRPRAAEGRRRGPPPGAAGGQPARHRGGPAPRAPGVPDGDRAGRPRLPRRRRQRRRHRGQAARRDRRRRAAGPLHRAPAPRLVARRRARRVRRPGRQAPGPGAGRGPRLPLGRGRLRRAARPRARRPPAVLTRSCPFESAPIGPIPTGRTGSRLPSPASCRKKYEESSPGPRVSR